jgi:hypothetical protein
MALITTVSTTPLTISLYPVWYQKKLDAFKRGEIDWDGNRLVPESEGGTGTPERSIEKMQGAQVRRLLVYLRLDTLPSLFTFIALLGGDQSAVAAKVHRSKTELETVPEREDPSTDSTSALVSKRPLEVHGVRMLELTERTSSVMKSSELDEYSYRDPVVNAFRTFAQLNNVAVSGGVSIVPEASYAETLTSSAADHFSDLVLIPWSESGSISETDSADGTQISGIQDVFIQKILGEASCNTAIFVNRAFGGPSLPESRTLSRTVSGLSIRSHRSHRETPIQPIADRSHHVYFPFFGGADDRVALRFVLQLAQNRNITATIIHFNMPIQSTYKTPEVTNEAVRAATGRASSSHLSISERVDTETLYAGAAQDTALLHTLRDSLPAALSSRVVFVDVATTTPIADCLDHARQEIGQSPRNAGDLVIVGRGKHTRMNELAEMAGASANVEMRRTLGAVAESIISGGVRGSVLVIQAGGRGLEA